MHKIVFGRIGGLLLIALLTLLSTAGEREREIDDRAGAPLAAVSPDR